MKKITLPSCSAMPLLWPFVLQAIACSALIFAHVFQARTWVFDVVIAFNFFTLLFFGWRLLQAKFGLPIPALFSSATRDDLGQEAPETMLISTVSHEIRTPLNGIMGMISLLMEDDNLTQAQKQKISTIYEGGQTLLRVVNDVLDFSRLEHGKMGLEIKTFDIQELVENTQELLATSARTKGLEVSCHVAADVPRFLRGDAGRISQVLTNLLSNAIKFTLEGAVMTEVLLEKDSTETVRIMFKVTDSGMGITPELQENLFERFNRSAAKTPNKYGGSGLGLAICKSLVEMMGGDIAFRSEPNKGSSFYFSLPLQKSQKQMHENLLDLRGRRVLVVDDHDFNRHIFEKQLEKLGAQIVTAADGPRAITLIKEAAREGQSFDLAILDQNMPNMSGEELAEYLRVEQQEQKIKLVLASSEDVSANLAHYKEIGFDSVLTKPVRERTLHQVVADLLDTGEHSPASSAELAKLRILLVEDNMINQVFAQSALEKHVAYVAIASNGLEALKVYQKEAFHLILMDVQMPEMDGHEATRHIRQMELDNAWSRTPVLALTAGVNPENHHACLQAGMNDVLLKPIDPKDLLIRIRQHASVKLQDRSDGMVVEDKG